MSAADPVGGGLPVVALVGRPNVGKSSLFNRLVGGRPALVQETPGVTRDRRYGLCRWNGSVFRLVDTGGLDPGATGILAAMRTQTLRAIDEAVALVLVLDTLDGLTPVDREVARVLRRSGKPVLVAANKVDSGARESGAVEAFDLGFPRVLAISAEHGRGIGDLLDAILDVLPPGLAPAPAAGPQASIRVAFVGKPNVGKSSLVNRLLGQERVLVHDLPGTTRDPIDTPFSSGGRSFVLVDTAGLRRRRSVATTTERVAAAMARDQLTRADVAALVIDARAGATGEDARLGSELEASGRAAVLILNKADLVPRADLDRQVASSMRELAFLSWAPLLLTSAVTGRGVAQIPETVAGAFDQWSRRVGTAELNRLFEEIVSQRPPPAGPGGRHVRLYYATQAGVQPPTFYVSASHPAAVGHAYRRFLINRIRKEHGFVGSPLRVVLRAHRPAKPGAKPGAKGSKPRKRKRREKRG